jgi:riboflavin synthase alpha subunit
MFTGIVQALGIVQNIHRRSTGARMVVDAPDLERPIADGASICVNGTCLTVVASDQARIEFDVVHETLSRTTLGDLSPGHRVNLEPSLRPSDRVDGHFVQGHIDGTARIRQVGSGSAGQLWTFEASSDLMPYIIPKGSIAIEGISLTIASVQENTFGIALIPTTLERTTLGRMKIGDRVNIETDILVRTIVATLRRYSASGRQPAHSGAGLTVEQLLENGW